MLQLFFTQTRTKMYVFCIIKRHRDGPSDATEMAEQKTELAKLFSLLEEYPARCNENFYKKLYYV
jgi:hypothetical protein